MFQLTMCNGQNLGVPDVCLTPSPPTGFIPIPYPNISMSTVALPTTTATTILVDGTPSLNMMSEIPLSNGNNAGVKGGAVSQVMMGPTRYMLGSLNYFLKGSPAVKLTSLTGQNGTPMNAPGMTIVPSQLTVLVLS
ncbi:MAG: DUF4150 domain-containing protein [Campylobacterota bacterium]|nr:DUF4150 domain-containing protein [Campylobacterota bacterium]